LKPATPMDLTRSEPQTQGIRGADLPGPRLPKAPPRPEQTGIPVQALEARIDSFLESRGYKAPTDIRGVRPQEATQSAAAFVCEDDVRAALKAGRKVVIDEKTIVTPSARDLGEAQKVFVEAGWPR